jgi:RES domain-containing protein
VVYTSESLALAALEVLVHADRDVLPADLVQIEIEVPDALRATNIDVDDLPRNWRIHPAPNSLQRIGDEWLVSGTTPVLQVPSAVIPEEHNLLINPEHSDATAVRVMSTAEFDLDPRLGS